MPPIKHVMLALKMVSPFTELIALNAILIVHLAPLMENASHVLVLNYLSKILRTVLTHALMVIFPPLSIAKNAKLLVRLA